MLDLIRSEQAGAQAQMIKQPSCIMQFIQTHSLWIRSLSTQSTRVQQAEQASKKPRPSCSFLPIRWSCLLRRHLATHRSVHGGLFFKVWWVMERKVNKSGMISKCNEQTELSSIMEQIVQLNRYFNPSLSRPTTKLHSATAEVCVNNDERYAW